MSKGKPRLEGAMVARDTDLRLIRTSSKLLEGCKWECLSPSLDLIWRKTLPSPALSQYLGKQAELAGKAAEFPILHPQRVWLVVSLDVRETKVQRGHPALGFPTAVSPP